MQARTKVIWTLPPKNKGIFSEWVKITPEIAALMLTHNQSNRPLSDHFVGRLAKKMEDGAWEVTHQGIGFSQEGQLLDGQHRLAALVKTGMTFEFQVTYNLDNVFDNIDVDQKGRSAADLLYLRDSSIKHRAEMVATARMMLTGRGPVSQRLRNSDIAEYTLQQKDLITPFITELRRGAKCVRKAALYGAFCAAVRQDDGWPGPKGYRDRDAVMLMAMKLGSMEFDGRDDPMGLLQRKLDSMSTPGGGTPADAQVIVYRLSVAAIRAGIAGKKIKALYATEVDWGDVNDHGGPLSVKRRTVNKTRLRKKQGAN